MVILPIETGFAGLKLPNPAELPVPAHQPDLTLHELVKIARLMVMNIRPMAITLRSFSITAAQFEAWVQRHPIYQNAFKTFMLEWESPLNTKQRIAIESAAALEDAIPDIAVRMADASTPFNQVIEGAKALAKFAGVGEQGQENTDTAQRVSININLAIPDKKAPVSMDQIQSQPQGDRKTITIQALQPPQRAPE